MTIAPITATMEPIISYLSGFFLSTILPHRIADTMNIPPKNLFNELIVLTIYGGVKPPFVT